MGCAGPAVPPLLAGDTAVFAKESSAPAAPVEQWWRGMNDPVLDSLVDKALAGNQNLKAIAARMDAAANYEAAAPFSVGPNMGLSSSVSNRSERVGDADPVKSRAEGHSFNVQWEVPLFGKGQAQLASAKAQLRQSQRQEEAAQVSLAAAVVRSYAQLKSAVGKVESAQKTLAAYKEIAEVRTAAVTAGLAPAQDAENARTQVLSAESQLASLQAQKNQLQNGLAVLCGTTSLKMLNGLTAQIASVPEIQKVDPSLLRKRPDVMAAEEAVAVAAAQAGIDRASLWPQLSLGASINLNPGTDTARTLTNVGSMGLSIPLLNWFSLKAQADASTNYMKASVEDYRQTVLSAWEEAQAAYTDGIAAQKRAQNANELQATLEAQAARAAALEAAGIGSRIDRLNAEVSRNSQLSTASEEKSQLLQAWARLQKASFARVNLTEK